MIWVVGIREQYALGVVSTGRRPVVVNFSCAAEAKSSAKLEKMLRAEMRALPWAPRFRRCEHWTSASPCEWCWTRQPFNM